jgi:hypothetical protein
MSKRSKAMEILQLLTDISEENSDVESYCCGIDSSFDNHIDFINGSP